MYYVFISARVTRHITPSFVWIHIDAFIPTYWHMYITHTKDVDDVFSRLNYRVEVEFDQSSHASHHDQNLIEGEFGYARKIQEIM
jgi:hypothetical protein